MSLQQQMQRFLQLEVESQFLSAAIELLGMTSLENKKPTKNLLPNPEDGTSDTKKAYLRQTATLAVHSYIIDRQRNDSQWALFNMRLWPDNKSLQQMAGSGAGPLAAEGLCA